MIIFTVYMISFIIFLFFIFFGLAFDGVSSSAIGLKSIVLNQDILVTDYIHVGGIGGAFVNAGLISIFSLLILIFFKVQPTGAIIMGLWLMLGFGLMGKNIFNIWPLMFGVWLHSKYKKEPFTNYILVALLSTSLSPIVSQLSFSSTLNRPFAIFLGVLLGVFCGFILPPLSSNCVKIHHGYNLYNMGFAAGLLGTLFMSIFRSLGFNFDSKLIWYSGNNLTFSIFLIFIFLILIIFGLCLNKFSMDSMKNINSHDTSLAADYYFLYGSSAYINMGILGIGSTLLVVSLNGTLNGPSIGAICTIVGFGAFGKNIKNILPVIIGACISSLLNIWSINSPQMILSILFSTTLAPIATKFGFYAGLIAGFLHVCIVMNTSYLHGGLNLYNNGLAGGIVVIILVPLIKAFKKEPQIKDLVD